MISLLCPTRGRPDNVRRFAESAWSTAEGPVEVWFYVDEDDEASTAAYRALETPVSHAKGLSVGPRLVLSECWNDLAEAALSAQWDDDGPILGQMGDDVVFRTPGWDRRVRQAFERLPNSIGFVHGDDGVHGCRLGTHGFVHRRWVETVGYLTPHGFSHDYGDTWLNDVADRISRRVYLPHVLTEHLHPDVGKAEYDQTYRDHAAAGERDNVAALYAAREPERERDAKKLRAAMTTASCL